MYELNDLLLQLRSSQPVISIQTHEEQRAVDLIKRCSVTLNKPIFQWSITRGMVDAVSDNRVLELAEFVEAFSPGAIAGQTRELAKIREYLDEYRYRESIRLEPRTDKKCPGQVSRQGHSIFWRGTQLPQGT